MNSHYSYPASNMNTPGVPSAQVWKPTPAVSKRPPRRRGLLLVSLLVGALVIATVLGAANIIKGDSTLIAQDGTGTQTSIDLNQSFPISPSLLGSNVFPKTGTISRDGTGSGFMSYDPSIIAGLKSAHVQLLRFPGGNWDEEHTPSTTQLDAFSSLLNQVGAEGLMQAKLSDPEDKTPVSLDTRASRAALLVDYMNNQQSIQRLGANVPFHSIKYWTIGNEPDLLTNPDTGRKYTVAEYVQAFITYSIAMHQKDHNIKIFGPEISQYENLQGPKDATGTPWMKGFLTGISSYQRTHALPFSILDGISFHRYPFGISGVNAQDLLNEPSLWNSSLPTLRQFIREQFGMNLPIAITEINTNSGKVVPAQNLAATWWAETLGELMNNQVEYVAFFSTEGVDIPYPLFSQPGLKETSLLHTMEMFARLQKNLIPLQGQNGPVNIYATQSNDHNTVSLLLLNRTATSQQVSVRQDSILPLVAWHSSSVSIDGYGMVVLTLHRNGNNEALSFTNREAAQ